MDAASVRYSVAIHPYRMHVDSGKMRMRVRLVFASGRPHDFEHGRAVGAPRVARDRVRAQSGARQPSKIFSRLSPCHMTFHGNPCDSRSWSTTGVACGANCRHRGQCGNFSRFRRLFGASHLIPSGKLHPKRATTVGHGCHKRLAYRPAPTGCIRG
jgi:hypothetical protein